MMKIKIFSALVAFGLLAGAVSCSKQDNPVRGNYSFKTSGTLFAVRDSAFRFDTSYVSRRDTSGNWVTDTLISENMDSTIFSIDTESGQMDITPMSGDRDLITMNCTAGDLIVYYGIEKDGEIVLESARRHLKTGIGGSTISSGDEEVEYSDTSVEADIVVTGSARKYDNILLFTLDYRGTYKYNNTLYNIYDSDIYCRAKENE